MIRSRRTGTNERTHEQRVFAGKIRSHKYTNAQVLAIALVGCMVGVGLGASSTDPQATWITLGMYVIAITAMVVADIRAHRRTVKTP